MSQWGLEDEEEYDFELAPDTASDEDETGAEQVVEDGDGGAWDLEDAVSHSSGAVHLWFTERRLSHARVSNRWRERIKDESLTDVVCDVLQRGQTPQLGWTPEVPALDEPFPKRSLGDVLGVFLDRTLDLDDRTRQLDEKPDDEVVRTHHEGTEVEGNSRNRAVTVRLTIQGTTKDLVMDEDWLEGARAEEISSAIVEAHADAYSRHTPPTEVLGEYAELARERRQLATEILASMAP